MSLDLISEVWDALRGHIDLNDRKDAADALVNLLIENNYETEDIKEEFRGDKDITTALKYYARQHDYEEEYDDQDDLDHEED